LGVQASHEILNSKCLFGLNNTGTPQALQPRYTCSFYASSHLCWNFTTKLSTRMMVKSIWLHGIDLVTILLYYPSITVSCYSKCLVQVEGSSARDHGALLTVLYGCWCLYALYMYSCCIPMFVSIQDKAILADTARRNFFRPGGDHLTLLNVYNEVSMYVIFNVIRQHYCAVYVGMVVIVCIP